MEMVIAAFAIHDMKRLGVSDLFSLGFGYFSLFFLLRTTMPPDTPKKFIHISFGMPFSLRVCSCFLFQYSDCIRGHSPALKSLAY